VTEDASRSSQAAARATDGSVAANYGATVFADVSLTECAAVMTATISICAARLAKTTQMARHAGFEEIEEWLVLGPSVAARMAYRSGVSWEGARPMADAGDFGRAGLGALPRLHPSGQHRRDTTPKRTSFQTEFNIGSQ
jgi:hypothetical protein